MRLAHKGLIGISLLSLSAAGLVLTGALPLPWGPKAAAKAAEQAAKEVSGNTPAVAAPEAVSVTVEKATTHTIQRIVQVVGTFQGLDEMAVTPKVQGRVVKLYHDLGDVVRPGERLFDIDPVDYQLAVDEARKSLQAELAKLGLTQLPTGAFDVSQLPSVVRARNQEENAARRKERTEQLRQRKMISEQEADQCTTEHLVATSTRRQAELDAQSTLATAQYKWSMLETAQQRLRDTQVEVPFPTQATAESPEKVEYAVSERLISEGEMVRGATGTAAFRLVIDKQLKLRAAVPERYVGEVKTGQTVQLAVDAYPGEDFVGKILRVSPTVDRTSRTFQIEASVPNDARRLKSGGFTKASILTNVDTRAVVAPLEAVVTFAGTTKVFVVREGRAHVVPVEQGVAGHGWVEIKGDVASGALVLTSGHARVVEGTPVQVRAVAVARSTAGGERR